MFYVCTSNHAHQLHMYMPKGPINSYTENNKALCDGNRVCMATANYKMRKLRQCSLVNDCTFNSSRKKARLL